MNYSVWIGGDLYDVVIPRKPTSGNQFYVKLVCGRTKRWRYLCMLSKGASYNGSWTCVAMGQDLTGPRLVNGFKTQVQAFEYAIQIDPHINTEFKAMRDR